MTIVVAIDSLKGSLSSIDAGKAIAQGIRRVSDAQVIIKPLADGGEGTVEALVMGMEGTYQSILVTGPLGQKVEARYGLLASSQTAIIEMSSAAGITLVPNALRNPMHTTTYGVGEIINDAIEKGCRHFIVGIGGSATNDGGIGMLQALGFEFLDANGDPIGYGAQGLSALAEIKVDHVNPKLIECDFKIACDVVNPLCGEKGCSYVYGPQKGADADMVSRMDQVMLNYSQLVTKHTGKDCANVEGAGAAGGMGYAFISFLKAQLQSGIQIVLEETALEQEIMKADIVITGEGRLDFQTAMGKAPIGVAKLAKKYNKMVIAFSGAVTEDAKRCNDEGIDAYFPILRSITTLEQAMQPEIAASNLADTAEQVFRLVKAINK